MDFIKERSEKNNKEENLDYSVLFYHIKRKPAVFTLQANYMFQMITLRYG